MLLFFAGDDPRNGVVRVWFALFRGHAKRLPQFKIIPLTTGCAMHGEAQPCQSHKIGTNLGKRSTWPVSACQQAATGQWTAFGSSNWSRKRSCPPAWTGISPTSAPGEPGKAIADPGA